MEMPRMFGHILVPVDGSETSIEAGRVTIRLAAIQDSDITFVYVVDGTTVDEIARATSRPAESVHRDLENTGKRYLTYLTHLCEESGLRSQQVIRSGIPHSEIVGFAQEQRVNLIVIGRVGCRGPRCILMGSVAGRVVESAPCPVLVVNQDSGGR